MCLIKGRGAVSCSHPTCIRSLNDPDFYLSTKRQAFMRRDDIKKIKLSRDPDTHEPRFLKLPNPYSAQNNRKWRDYELFKAFMGETKAVGEWPNGRPFKKHEVDFQFFLYARRFPKYNALTETQDFELVLDVEEAAVYFEPQQPTEGGAEV